MTIACRNSSNIAAVLTLALAAGAMTGAARAQSTGIVDNNGIFIDGKTFQIVPGKGNGDVANRLSTMGAREIGPGAIIFRSGDKLYIAGAPMGTPALEPQKGPVFIEYEPPKDPALQDIYERIKERRGLEIFKGLLSPFRLPVNLTVRTQGCDGVANAYFDRDGDKRSIRICYEYLKQLVNTLPKETTPAGITPQDALVGQFLFAILHESGHAMFDIFQTPIWGHQEDSADQFATYIMLQFGAGKAHRLIKGAAYAYHGYIKQLKDKPEVRMPLAAFSSDHGQPEERFYNLVCMAYGYDPKEFAEAVSGDWLPESRAKKCKWQYEDAQYAFQQTMGPHIDKEQARKVLDDTPWLASDSTPAPANSTPAAAK